MFRLRSKKDPFNFTLCDLTYINEWFAGRLET